VDGAFAFISKSKGEPLFVAYGAYHGQQGIEVVPGNDGFLVEEQVGTLHDPVAAGTDVFFSPAVAAIF
jgi:hypothetical protein